MSAGWIDRNRTAIMFALGGALLVEQVVAKTLGVGFEPLFVGVALALMGLDRVLPKAGG